MIKHYISKPGRINNMNLNNNSNYKIELIIEIFKEYSNEYYEYY